jgi:Na+-driven multidrug efflux pump
MTLFCELLIEVLNFYFVGHLNSSAKLAGVGLATMYINILC